MEQEIERDRWVGKEGEEEKMLFTALRNHLLKSHLSFSTEKEEVPHTLWIRKGDSRQWQGESLSQERF